jgi:hypothetical protein
MELVPLPARNPEPWVSLESGDERSAVSAAESNVRVDLEDDVGAYSVGVLKTHLECTLVSESDATVTDRLVVRNNVEEPHERNFVAELQRDPERVVGGAVVDDHPELRRACLLLHALTQPVQVLRVVPDGRDDDVGKCHGL